MIGLKEKSLIKWSMLRKSATFCRDVERRHLELASKARTFGLARRAASAWRNQLVDDFASDNWMPRRPQLFGVSLPGDTGRATFTLKVAQCPPGRFPYKASKFFGSKLGDKTLKVFKNGEKRYDFATNRPFFLLNTLNSVTPSIHIGGLGNLEEVSS